MSVLQSRRFRLAISKHSDSHGAEIHTTSRRSRLRHLALYLDLLPLFAVAVMLGWMGTHAGKVGAQSPDDAVAIIQSQGAPFSACLMAIANRETGGTFDPYAVNPYSGAFGEFQFLQHGGEWDVVGGGEPVTVATVAEQVAAATKALMLGHGSMAWQTQSLPACSGT